MRFVLVCTLLILGCAPSKPAKEPARALDPDKPLRPPAVERIKQLLFPQIQFPQRSLHVGMCCALPHGEGYRMWYTSNCAGGYHICWADFDREWEKTAESEGPCFTPGEKGTFDSSAVFMPCVVDPGAGDLRMYYAAHAEGPFPGKGSSAGVAVSRDGGLSWEKRRQTLKADGDDAAGVGTQFVWQDENEWRMIYTHIVAEKKRYFMKFARSLDGFTWERPSNNVALDLDSMSTSTRPCVFKHGPRYYMTYTCNRSDQSGYRIRFADSDDGWRFTDRGQILGTDRTSQWDNKAVSYGWVL
ncbi:MAG: hypothetical protein AB7O26_15055, partial [Planctomycetaceae bacterium]